MFLVENRHHGQPLEFLGKFHGNPIRVAPCHDPGELVDDQSAMFPFKYDFNPEFFRHTGALLGFPKKPALLRLRSLPLNLSSPSMRQQVTFDTSAMRNNSLRSSEVRAHLSG
jgi:hypothetical protein